MWTQDRSNIDLVVQGMFVSRLASESPIAGWCLGDGNLNVVREDANFRFDSLE
jgi:hypothetical protein